MGVARPDGIVGIWDFLGVVRDEKNFSMGYMGVNCGWECSFTIGNTNPIGIPLGIVVVGNTKLWLRMGVL